MMNTLVAQANTRLLQHIDRSIIQPEATLKADLEFLAHQAFLTTGIPVNVRTARALETLSLITVTA
jgi:hypothetical protein